MPDRDQQDLQLQQQTLRVQQLFVRHQGAFKAFVLALWPDFAEADDVMQEVFLVIATAIQALGPKVISERNRALYTNDLVDEQIDIVTRGFLGLTAVKV
jgi:hypothetical protein